MKKLLLVNTNTEKSPYPIPPLGLCLLASALDPDYLVKVYDGVFEEGHGLRELVGDFRPDYIGFSIRNIDDVVADRHIFYLNGIVDDFILPVREVSRAPFILGGSGFSIFPVEIMKMTSAEYGIRGEGVAAFRMLLHALDEGTDPRGIPGLYLKGGVSGQEGRGYLPQKWSLPHSRIDRWIDFSPYLSRGVYSIQTKRGCARRCVYCNYPCIEGRKIRLRDPADIVTEMEEVSGRLGDVVVEFVDSTFNDPPGFAESLCTEIIRRRLKIRMRTMGINPGNTSARLFDLMVRAGFTQIDVTPDSASASVLKRLGKGFSLREIRDTADLIRRSGMPAMWFFLFGGPGETEQTFDETLEFIDSFVCPDDLVYMNAGMRVYPETPLHLVAVAEALVAADQEILYPPVFYYSPLIGKKRLDELIRKASDQRINCIPALETQPPPELLMQAARIRAEQNLREPMFRTLLRLRRERDR